MEEFTVRKTATFTDGTRYELHAMRCKGLSKTVYVDQNGWHTTNWWTSPAVAVADYEATVERARKEGRLLEASMPDDDVQLAVSALKAGGGILSKDYHDGSGRHWYLRDEAQNELAELSESTVELVKTSLPVQRSEVVSSDEAYLYEVKP